jgi:hypothetical protein
MDEYRVSRGRAELQMHLASGKFRPDVWDFCVDFAGICSGRRILARLPLMMQDPQKSFGSKL